MAKTNYTKVEEALAEGLRKMQINELCELADIASGNKNSSSDDLHQLSRRYLILLRRLKMNIERLHRSDKGIYKSLKVKKKSLERQFKSPEKLTKEEWIALVKLYKQTQVLISKHFPHASDIEIIEQEQKKHINKRFNVKDDWLPLQ